MSEEQTSFTIDEVNALPPVPTVSQEAVAPVVKEEPAADAPVVKEEAVPVVKEEPVKEVAGDLEKDAGWNQVNFDNIPEEHRQAFKERFNRLYGQLKHNQRALDEATRYNNRLDAKLDTVNAHLTELKKTQATVSQTQEEKALDDLAARAEAAYKDGNFDESWKLLNELHAKDEALRKGKEEEQKTEETEKEEMARRQETATIMKEWAANKPYAQPNHPLFKYTDAAYKTIIKEVQTNPQLKGASMKDVLAAIDTHMAKEVFPKLRAARDKQLAKKTAAVVTDPNEAAVAQVLGNTQGVARAAPTKATMLSPEQKIVAWKFNSDKKHANGAAFTREDAYKHYVAGMQDDVI